MDVQKVILFAIALQLPSETYSQLDSVMVARVSI